VADLIENFCAETRKSLHEHGFAVSKHVRGKIPDNVAADRVNRAGTRLRRTETGGLSIAKTRRTDLEFLQQARRREFAERSGLERVGGALDAFD